MTKPTELRAIPLHHRSALDDVLSFIDAHGVSGPDDDDIDYNTFEREFLARSRAFEREVLRRKLEAADVDEPAVLIDGVRHTRVLSSHTNIVTPAGDVRVKHTLYKNRADKNARSVSPLHKRLGLVEGFTPEAASLALFVVTELVPDKAAELFERLGAMQPSKSTLDRLPKRLAEVWEKDRAAFEQALREATEVPDDAKSLAVSLDGVLAPMADAERSKKRKKTAAKGKLTKGPAGYREVGCGTVTFCDGKGEMLSAVRMARAPQEKKKDLKEMLVAEVDAALTRRPDLTLVKLADGAEDNWSFFEERLPDGVEVFDFFHAAGHLNDALAAAYGDGTVETRRRFSDLRFMLLEVEGGVDNVIRSLVYLQKKHPKKKRIGQVIRFFRKQRHRMKYAEFRAAGLPIGSGLVEAACKTLVTQRLKRSGMQWSQEGAQAILTPRGWTQSARFDHAWALVAAEYQANVVLVNAVEEEPAPRHSNVIPFPGRGASR